MIFCPDGLPENCPAGRASLSVEKVTKAIQGVALKTPKIVSAGREFDTSEICSAKALLRLLESEKSTS